MKELSVEEKAKRYDEIIKKANKMHHENCEACQICIEELIPELCESEDERIIKAIKSAVLQLTDIYLQEKYGLKQSDCIAWLEKQGEQKPAWSEEDGRCLINAILACEQMCNEDYDYSQSYIDAIKWLESLKDRVQPQPMQEWSEETQQWIDAIIKDYEGWYDADKDHRATIQIKINILKSLRLQNTWKPSEEQMNAFDAVLVYNPPCSDECRNHLITLYNELKKLKG